MALRVLTVDDSKTIRMIVKKAFAPFDCVLFEAENGVEGLATANKQKPDLIVLDITMPVMNGIEMLEKLKSEPHLKDIPVIMLTAESGKDNVMHIVSMGVKDYIVKPFKGEQLIERVAKIFTLQPASREPNNDDAVSKYFVADGDIQQLVLPDKITRPVSMDVDGLLPKKIGEMTDAGIGKMILDMRKVTETNVTLIKLILGVIGACQKAAIAVRLVGSAHLGEELKAFQETGDLPIDMTVDQAKAAF